MTGTADKAVAVKAINQVFAAVGGFNPRSGKAIEVDGCSVTVTCDQSVSGEDMTLRFKNHQGTEIAVPRFNFR